MDGDTDESPIKVRIVVRRNGGGISATLPNGVAPARARYGTRTRNSLTASTPDKEVEDARFPDLEVRKDMGRALFQNLAVREKLARHVEANHYVRLILDLEGDLCSAMWETALPPAADDSDPSDPWHHVPRDPIGLWAKVAIVRDTAEYTQDERNRTEPLFDGPDPSAFVIDARGANQRTPLDVRLPVSGEMVAPFDFQVAESDRGDVLAAKWLETCKVLHYVGHAISQGLELDGATATWEMMRDAIAKRSSLRLVVLEACSTAGENPSNDKIPFAWKLAQQVPAVVAMLSEIWSDSADLFTEVFYGELSRRVPVDFAVARARRSLFERGAASGHTSDWMLPVLFLSTPGSATVPRRDDEEPEAVRGPLHLFEAATASAAVMRRVLAGSAFRDVPADASMVARPMVISARGDVSAALVGHDILIDMRPGSAPRGLGFADRFSAGIETLSLLAVRTQLDGGLEVAVADSDAAYLVSSNRPGVWDDPKPIDGSRRAELGIFLGDKFLGWDAAESEFVGEATSSAPAAIGAELRAVSGIDAVSLDVHDVVAAWGIGWNGRSSAIVVARRRGKPGWTPVGLVRSPVVQLGLARPQPGMRSPSSGTSTVIVGFRAPDGAIELDPPFDLTDVD